MLTWDPLMKGQDLEKVGRSRKMIRKSAGRRPTMPTRSPHDAHTISSEKRSPIPRENQCLRTFHSRDHHSERISGFTKKIICRVPRLNKRLNRHKVYQNSSKTLIKWEGGRGKKNFPCKNRSVRINWENQKETGNIKMICKPSKDNK